MDASTAAMELAMTAVRRGLEALIPALLAWVEGGMAFVVAGPAERERLDRVARRVYDAYEQPAEQR
jgi:anti-sigma factor RsiW